MSCEQTLRRLDDLVDGVLSERDRHEVEQHLAVCQACRDQADALRSLLERAAALPATLEPERDLWPVVAVRISRGKTVKGRFGLGARWARVSALAATASALVLAGSVITLSVVRRDPGPRPAATLPSDPTTRSSFSLASLGSVGSDLLEARDELLAALDQRAESLSPETVTVINDNLQIIDDSIARIEGALERDPGNRELTALLAATCRQEIRLLQRATRLPAEI